VRGSDAADEYTEYVDENGNPINAIVDGQDFRDRYTQLYEWNHLDLSRADITFVKVINGIGTVVGTKYIGNSSITPTSGTILPPVLSGNTWTTNNISIDTSQVNGRFVIGAIGGTFNGQSSGLSGRVTVLNNQIGTSGFPPALTNTSGVLISNLGTIINHQASATFTFPNGSGLSGTLFGFTQ
jgi:hypothetical protein